jgi:hypothetical protein
MIMITFTGDPNLVTKCATKKIKMMMHWFRIFVELHLFYVYVIIL